MADDVIRFEDVVKQYRRGVERSNLRAANPWADPAPFDPETTVTALDHVDLSIAEGESIGIIGDNGQGKSTLLKLIAGVLAPTSGVVKTRGKIASIIELGVGFHDDLTGLENIEFTGALLGMSPAEMRKRTDEIVEFSGISSAINTPVKRYSSGMLARLGFAVATHVDADIVLVDEVLAVGDIEFQRLSLERLESLIDDGVTTVLVSHNLAAVRHLCHRVTRLDQGKLVADGGGAEVIREYGGRMVFSLAGLGKSPIKLLSLRVTPSEVRPLEPFSIEAEIEVERAMPRGQLRMVLRPTAEMVAMVTQTAMSDDMDLAQLVEVPVPTMMLSEVGTWRITGHVDRFPLFAGSYLLTLELTEERHDEILDIATALITVPGSTFTQEPVELPVTWGVDPYEAP
jgi:ABC-type polysaccharide/polyol phosphate transport system ATPase subunit